MPPHCDSLDGPVVTAARRALDTGDVDFVLPYVDAGGEDEVHEAFDRVMPLRDADPKAADLAYRWFFETVVRVHRAGENAPYTGLKPAGLDVGPVIPAAEKAVATGQAEELYRLLAEEMRSQLEQRLNRVERLAASREASVPAAREHVEAMLGFEVYTNHLYHALRQDIHDGHE